MRLKKEYLYFEIHSANGISGKFYVASLNENNRLLDVSEHNTLAEAKAWCKSYFNDVPVRLDENETSLK